MSNGLRLFDRPFIFLLGSKLMIGFPSVGGFDLRLEAALLLPLFMSLAYTASLPIFAVMVWTVRWYNVRRNWPGR